MLAFRPVSKHSSLRVLIAAVMSAASLAVWSLPASRDAVGARPAPAIKADFNRDGAPDQLSVSSAGRLTLTVTGQPIVLALHRSIAGVAVGDIDRDGDRDIVGLSATGNVNVWRNDGRGKFQHSKTLRHPVRRSMSGQHSIGSAPEADNVAEGPERDAPGPFAATTIAFVDNDPAPFAPAVTSRYRAPDTSTGRPRAPPLPLFA